NWCARCRARPPRTLIRRRCFGTWLDGGRKCCRAMKTFSKPPRTGAKPGSAPRPVGSNLVIDNEGNFLGSVSGGCVEGAVVTEAIDVIDNGKPKMLEF